MSKAASSDTSSVIKNDDSNDEVRLFVFKRILYKLSKFRKKPQALEAATQQTTHPVVARRLFQKSAGKQTGN